MSLPLWTAEDICAVTNGSLANSTVTWPAQHAITGLSINTRNLAKGDLFIPFIGKARDGHNLIPDAFDKGASGALCDKKTFEKKKDLLAPCAERLIFVDDVPTALDDMARARRAAYTGTVIGITGSVGKTTTRALLAQALSPFGTVHASRNSLNNHIGVPLSVARTPLDADCAVFEMGMNHADEIEFLGRFVQPHHTIITAIAPVHLENFASEEGIAHAKAEIVLHQQHDGISVLPFDTPHLPILIAAAKTQGIQQILTFSRNAANAAMAQSILSHPQVSWNDSTGIARLQMPSHHGNMVDIDLRLQMTGEHFLSNALACVTLIHAMGLDAQVAADAMAELETEIGRGQSYPIRLANAPDKDAVLTLIDDRHNASPISMRAAFESLSAAFTNDHRHQKLVLCLGDMLELGKDENTLHAELAPDIAKLAPHAVFTCGARMAHLHESLRQNDKDQIPHIIHFDTANNLATKIPDLLSESLPYNAVLFIKGSRGAAMHHVLNAVRQLDADNRYTTIIAP